MNISSRELSISSVYLTRETPFQQSCNHEIIFSEIVKKKKSPIFRELTGKYWVTGFLIVRRSFSRLPAADMLNFCSSSTAR